MRETTFHAKIRKAEKAAKLNNVLSPLYETRNMFRSAVGFDEPLSYDEWMSLRDDLKAAALYVQFFSQITLAWNKAKSFYTLEEDGVSTVLQYLEKNVPIIMKDESRFSPRYIYRVAYNCMYCICHDIKRDRDRWEKEISNIQEGPEGQFDIFTILGDDRNMEDDLHYAAMSIRFWDDVTSLGDQTVRYVEYLLGREVPGKKIMSKEDEIVAELRRVLNKYRRYFEV